MATTAISVPEYLASIWHPDRDYVDGEVQERNLGEQEHALLQNYLAAWFFNHRHDWRIVSLTEMRVQVSPTRFRIPDNCLREPSDPMDRVLQRPPLLCVEIMSPEDRLAKVRERLQDFVAMGVHDIWVIDPGARRAYVCVAGEFSESDEDTLRIAGTEIHVRLADLWAELER